MNLPATSRRSFLQQATVLAAGSIFLSAGRCFGSPYATTARAFRMSLNPFAIGVTTNQKELPDLARRHGFEAIIPIPGQLAAMDKAELDDYTARMKEWSLSWDAAGLPVQFRESEQQFRDDLNRLPALAEVTQRAGGHGMSTWIMPTNAQLTYRQNFELHGTRLREVANILGHYGLKLGLEYVGPKTLMSRDKFSFIRSLREVRELIAAIGEDNVGVQLDSFHWFCAGETVADLLTLDARDIITCDLNDARAGLSADQQEDSKRELPVATGVIDLKAFLGALVQIGYAGPVRAEPFNAPLNEMDNDAALAATAAAMKKAFALV